MIRIHGKLACAQVKCAWLLPTYVNEVSDERVKDIDFSSCKKLKENLDQKINSLEDKAAKPAGSYRIQSSFKAAPPSAEEIGVSDLFNTENLDMSFPELLKLCLNVNLDISDEQIKQAEKDTRSQAKGSGFFRHRAGRIGASLSGVAFHSNLAQPQQSCVSLLSKFIQAKHERNQTRMQI